MKILSTLIITASTLLLTSCAAQYHGGLQPVSPMPMRTGLSPSWWIHSVDSLNPTLVWKNEDLGDTKYDLAIYTGVAKYPGILKDPDYVFYVQGVEVYHREGITGCSHTVEQLLEPETVYVWAVRTNNGSSVGPWSTYDYQRGGLKVLFPHDAPGQGGVDLWWSFMTPRK